MPLKVVQTALADRVVGGGVPVADAVPPPPPLVSAATENATQAEYAPTPTGTVDDADAEPESVERSKSMETVEVKSAPLPLLLVSRLA